MCFGFFTMAANVISGAARDSVLIGFLLAKLHLTSTSEPLVEFHGSIQISVHLGVESENFTLLSLRSLGISLRPTH